MNKKRKILITVIYNDLGIIVDTKAEEFDLSANLQQTCNQLATDTISRQAAVNEIAKFMLEYGGENEKRERDALHRAANGIKTLPSAQPEQRWVSSGKKPLKEGSYLVWMPFAPPKHRMAVAEYCGGYWNIKTPISAWMPLPEPYQAERREE